MTGKQRLGALALTLLLIVGAIVTIQLLVPQAGVGTPAAPDLRTEPLAPELAGITGWINSEPLTLKELRGQVVLVDFWTYTCVNCLRTFPYLKAWHQEYSAQGLVIIGVHTPEFAFEKERANLEAAVTRFGLSYPVAQDNDYGTWGAFGNRYWPAKYLIDKDGHIRYTHFGEGNYAETEERIQALLAEAGTLAASKATPSLPEFAAFPRPDLTRELYAGHERNYAFGGEYVANEQYYEQRGVAREYVAGEEHYSGQIYLQGLWFNGPESLVHARTSKADEDYLLIKFNAKSVNAVLGNGDGGVYVVWVTLDGKNLDAGNKGGDVTFDGEGRSVVVVTEPRMYRLVELPQFGTQELRVSSTSDQFALFAFAFGSYPKGP